MVLIQDRILKIDIYNFEMSYKTPEKSLKSNQIYSAPPPFPTASSFGTLVGGAHLMMSYLNKHFEPVPILCAVDFCLESRPVNPIVYLVKKK